MTRWITLLSTLLLSATLAYGESNSLWSSAKDGSPFKSLFSDAPAEFLPVEEAFQLSGWIQDDNRLIAQWRIAEDYYMYRKGFGFAYQGDAVQLGAPQIPAGIPKQDEFLGDVEVYYDTVTIEVPYSGTLPAQDLTLDITYQGCAEAGLCYPPHTQTLTLDTTQLMAAASPPAGRAGGTPAPPATEEGLFSQTLANGSLLAIVGLFFAAGLGLTFTPCVLPMVPILSSIIVGQKETGRGRAFMLSLVYVLGMALTYAAAGALMGLFGASLNLQAKLQSPVVLSVFAGLFVLLALSMFGLYELKLPQRLQDRLTALSGRTRGGSYARVGLLGVLSTLVVSPCVSAPLAGALVYISGTGDATLGGLALLALGLGMGVPLLLIGISGGALLPKAGHWMEGVKVVFGVMLLGVAIWLLERIVPAPLTLALWGALAMGSAVYLGALSVNVIGGWAKFRQATGLLLLVYGVLLMIGAAGGQSNPLQPLAGLQAQATDKQVATVQDINQRFEAVASVAQLQTALAQAAAEGQPVMLDLYADWCISCKVMEDRVFPAPEVSRALSQFKLLRADITANTAEHQALLQHFGLFGPPSLLFFRNGSELDAFRIQGEVERDDFARHLNTLLNGTQQVL